MSIGRLSQLAPLLCVGSILVATTGCGTATIGAGTNAASTAATSHFLTGSVHGGQQNVTGAAMTLWAAGTTGASPAGYGANATVVATTTTDANGNFFFDNVANLSPCTTGQLNYITAVGGTTGGATANTVPNLQSAMMAALPFPCQPALTGGQFVVVDEVTTVAAVWALQQFMTIVPGATGSTAPWMIGAPASNVVGLTNAFYMSTSLAYTTNGMTATSATSNTINSTVGGIAYITTVNPDFKKINTLGDILATCINSTGGAPCTSLFSDVTPGSASAPTDTIQAAYYLATNAGALTMPAHGNAQGSPYYLCTNYVAAASPFQPTLTCTTSSYPTDWTINVSYQAKNGATTVGTLDPANIAVDASGNIWTALYSTTTTAGTVAEFNVLGQLVNPPVTSTTINTAAGWYGSSYTGTNPLPLGGAEPSGAAYLDNALSIDTLGNAWYAGWRTPTTLIVANTNYAAAGTNETAIAQISPTGVSTGYLVGGNPGSIVADANNNIFVSNASDGAGSSHIAINELLASGGYTTFTPGIGRQGAYYQMMFVDQTANQYVTALGDGCQNGLQTNTAIQAQQTSYSTTANIGANNFIVTATAGSQTCVTTGAPDALGNIWGTANGLQYLEYLNLAAGTLGAGTGTNTTNTPVITQYTATAGTTNGGLATPYGVSIDGVGNVWVANYVGATSGGVSEFVPSNSGTTLTPLSPSGTAVYGFGSQNAYAKPVGTAIDPSGNVWIAAEGGSVLNVLVGAAAPVVTPTSLQVKNSAIGIKP
jgi:hypothetical protein